jgi:hypothetical protein
LNTCSLSWWQKPVSDADLPRMIFEKSEFMLKTNGVMKQLSAKSIQEHHNYLRHSDHNQINEFERIGHSAKKHASGLLIIPFQMQFLKQLSNIINKPKVSFQLFILSIHSQK